MIISSFYSTFSFLVFSTFLQWLHDVNQKVMLANEQPVPVILLANKVIAVFRIYSLLSEPFKKACGQKVIFSYSLPKNSLFSKKIIENL